MSRAPKVARSLDLSACSALNTFRCGSICAALQLGFKSQLLFEFPDAEVVVPRDAA